MEVSDVWNEVSDTWNQTPLLWGLVKKVILKGGDSGDNADLWDFDDEEKKKKSLNEEYVKVYITVYDKFLTEEQKKYLRITKLYPTYQEKIKIEKTKEIFLKEYKQKTGINLESKVNIKNIKLGFKKIISKC